MTEGVGTSGRGQAGEQGNSCGIRSRKKGEVAGIIQVGSLFTGKFSDATLGSCIWLVVS